MVHLMINLPRLGFKVITAIMHICLMSKTFQILDDRPLKSQNYKRICVSFMELS